MHSKLLSLVLFGTLGAAAPQYQACAGSPEPSSTVSVASAAPAASSAPSTTASGSAPASGSASASLASAILKVSPSTSSCASASGTDASQCATAVQAAPAILNSFSTYNVTTKNEMAAMISLMLYESVNFQYNINISPGRPGQGTRAMIEAPYTFKYAQSIPSIQSQLSQVLGGATDVSTMSTQTLNEMRGLLLTNPDLDFGAASWFLRTQCPEAVQESLKTGQQTQWENYLSTCVGVDASEGNRMQLYTATVAALGGF